MMECLIKINVIMFSFAQPIKRQSDGIYSFFPKMFIDFLYLKQTGDWKTAVGNQC